jgi:hypothetical protein
MCHCERVEDAQNKCALHRRLLVRRRANKIVGLGCNRGTALFGSGYRGSGPDGALLVMLKPETVIAWHRKGFRLYWASRLQERPPPCPHRSPRSHPADESRQSSLGCATHPWRIAQTRDSGVTRDGCQVRGPESQATLPNLKDIPQESQAGSGFRRLLRGSNRHVPSAVCIRDPLPRPATPRPLRRDHKSYGRNG